jgi:hypothetical protein
VNDSIVCYLWLSRCVTRVMANNEARNQVEQLLMTKVKHIVHLPCADIEYRFCKPKTYLTVPELVQLTFLRSRLGETQYERPRKCSLRAHRSTTRYDRPWSPNTPATAYLAGSRWKVRPRFDASGRCSWTALHRLRLVGVVSQHVVSPDLDTADGDPRLLGHLGQSS